MCVLNISPHDVVTGSVSPLSINTVRLTLRSSYTLCRSCNASSNYSHTRPHRTEICGAKMSKISKISCQIWKANCSPVWVKELFKL